MKSTMQITSPMATPFFFFWVFFAFFAGRTASDPRISEAGLFCGSGRPPTGTNFIPTFVREMESLSQDMSTHRFATHSTNSTLAPMYVLAQCHGDLSRTDCLLCYAASRTRLPRCLPAVSARIFLDGCFLRYDNYSFFSEAVDAATDTVNCSSTPGPAGLSSGAEAVVAEAVGAAGRGAGFGVVEGSGVYGLAQCWRSLGERQCGECLEKAKGEVLRKCHGRREGRSLNAGCYLRYSTDKFYNDKYDQSKNGSRFSRGVIIAIVIAAFALIMLSAFGVYAIYARRSNTRAARKNLGRVSTMLSRSGLCYKYETLERATDFFSASKKIGQGGAGSVYKGTLADGQVVAVKRLVFNTRQWVEEFFNEVNLISGIEHKNLVKLLGCSIEGPESLLVYEYVANRSLDQFLFEKSKVENLTWKQRFEIVVGTAEGLAYLHGDGDGGSKQRIIHRDIKSSNVLLDESLTPKIADFGLVRCFGADVTHLTTGIAGTLGYMAPEYLVRGQLTDKADVYSFGVLVLEIVCGRRNCAFTHDSTSLLQTVWKLYKSERLTEAIDTSLKDDFPAKEVSDTLQIGLLCTQASASLRPSMAEVVSMMTKDDMKIPQPNQPPFLNASVLDPSSSTKSFSTQSVASKAQGYYSTSTEICSTNTSSEGPSRV